jgi:hypothetical protein
MLTSHNNKHIIEEIILYEDFERLKSFITDSDGGRFVLTGYGRFGGTSLVKGAMNRAQRELSQRGMKEGALLAFYFKVNESNDNGGEFEIRANEFSLGTLTTENKSLIQFTLSKPLENSFLGGSEQKSRFSKKSNNNDFDFSRLFEQLNDFSTEGKNNSRLKEIVLQLIGSETLPSRIIFIHDRISRLETLEALAKLDLFKNEKITVIAVAHKEDFDPWVNYEQRLNRIGFKKWYVPCISQNDAFIEKINQALLEPFAIQNLETKDRIISLRKYLPKHLEFVGKGILGEVLEEFKHPQYWSSHKAGGFHLRLDALPHQSNIQHNAWMQDVLSLNWSTILGKLFSGKNMDEKEDRARISCYHLINWIADTQIFTKQQLLDEAAAPKFKITISDNQDVLVEVVQNLFLVLEAHRYLIPKNENQYRVMWDDSSPPKPKKVRLEIPTILSKAQTNPFESSYEKTSVKIVADQPIANDAIEISEEEVANISKHIFISYSHKDKEWLDKIRIMLKPLERKFEITVWDDTEIKPGSMWREEIKQALESAKVAVLLVSPNFLNSDFIAQHELPPLLQAAAKKGLIILWILITYCMHQETEINSYQATHDTSKPLDSLPASEQNKVLVQICESIKQTFNSQ